MPHHEAPDSTPAKMPVRARLTAFSAAAARENPILPGLPHSHPDRFEALLTGVGEGSVRVGGRLYPVRAGDLVMVNAGAVHEGSLWRARAGRLSAHVRPALIRGAEF